MLFRLGSVARIYLRRAARDDRLGVNSLGWTLMNHPLPWVELLGHGNTTYGSRWILQVPPTESEHFGYFARQRAGEIQMTVLLLGSVARNYLRRAARDDR